MTPTPRGLVIDHDTRPETCPDETHIDGCPGRAGGDHELDPHRAHVTSGMADQDCRDCERTYDYWNRGGPW